MKPTEPNDSGQRRFRRRDLLNAGARTLLLGGLAAYFAQQRQRAARLANDPNCIRLDTCSDCIEFGGCSLPKSVAHRAHSHQERLDKAGDRG